MIAPAAQAMSLLLVGMDPNMAGAVDRDSVKVQGDEVAVDLISIAGGPDGGDGLGRVAVSHMRFDCKGMRLSLTGGFSQSQSGLELKEVETHDWSPMPPSGPAWVTFQFVCFSRMPQPARTFSNFNEFLNFYDAALSQNPGRR